MLRPPRRKGSGKRRRWLERGEGLPLLNFFNPKLIIQSDVAGGGAEFDGGATAVVVHAVVVAGVHAVVVELVAEGA